MPSPPFDGQIEPAASHQGFPTAGSSCLPVDGVPRWSKPHQNMRNMLSEGEERGSLYFIKGPSSFVSHESGFFLDSPFQSWTYFLRGSLLVQVNAANLKFRCEATDLVIRSVLYFFLICNYKDFFLIPLFHRNRLIYIRLLLGKCTCTICYIFFS